MRSCQKCGAEVEREDIYCPDCGEKLAKETRKVNVWSILKFIVGLFILFIIIHLLKNNTPVGIFFLILFIIWAGVLNGILKKLFNTEISTGVKIVITVVIIASLVSISKFQTSQPQMAIQERPSEFRADYQDLYGFVEKINQVIESRDVGSLKRMLEEGMISPEVFEGLLKLIETKGNVNVDLQPQDQSIYGNQVEVLVTASLSSGSVQRRSGIRFFFEKEVNFENVRDFRWKLVKIDPNLLNVKLERSFEEEASYKIEKISSPIIATKQIQEGTDTKVCVTEPGKAIYPGNEKCCGGLKPIFGNENAYGVCQCTGENNNCGGAPICAPCGNKICEKEYREDKCNCPEDCK